MKNRVTRERRVLYREGQIDNDDFHVDDRHSLPSAVGYKKNIKSPAATGNKRPGRQIPDNYTSRCCLPELKMFCNAATELLGFLRTYKGISQPA